MKLHQSVSKVIPTLDEGQGPVPVVMTLDEIITAGKVTNPYQTYVLCWLTEFFKKGLRSIDLELESPITFDSQATHTVVVDAMKALSPEEQVNLAQYLKVCIVDGDASVHTRTGGHQMTSVQWINYVLAHQN